MITEEVSRKSCKTCENIVKFKIYALLDNFQSHPVGQIRLFGGLILATGPYIGLVHLIMQTFKIKHTGMLSLWNKPKMQLIFFFLPILLAAVLTNQPGLR